MVQDRKTGKENDGKSLLMEDDATCITDTPKIKDEVNLLLTFIKSKANLQDDQSATCSETTISEGLFVNYMLMELMYLNNFLL